MPKLTLFKRMQVDLPVLTTAQYQTVYNSLSFVIASFAGALLYFLISSKELLPKYRPAVYISSVIMLIAGYHYLRIFNSWEEAFSVKDHLYAPTGKYFNASYRYIDWFLTVPLLAVELIIGITDEHNRKASVYARYVLAAALMIVFGLVGDLSDDTTQRTIWAVLSTIPFIYLVAGLWKMIGDNLPNIPENLRSTASNLRYLTVATWGVYPVVYSFKTWNLTSACWLVAAQVLFCAADVLAKALFGLMIHWTAAARSKAEGYQIPA